jgi:hypothetical protein
MHAVLQGPTTPPEERSWFWQFVRWRQNQRYNPRSLGPVSNDVIRQEGRADFSMTYGLPGQPGYRYTRPFDYFHFEFTAVPNARSVPNAIENMTIRGLLIGATYEAGDKARGLWGLFGNYD